VSPVVGGSTGEDSVEILGEALGFHQRLTAAVGTTLEIGVRCRPAVERLDQALGVHVGFMQRAVAEIHDLLRVFESPARVRAVAFVPRVGGGGGVTAPEVARQRVIVDRPGEAAVAGRQEPAVPPGGGQPDLKTDVGIAGGPDDAGHAAECGEPVERAAIGRRERARADGLRADGGVGQGHGGERIAGGVREQRTGRGESE